ncbi:PREDICTED: myosin-14-like [Nicotiana attenuata]|uniref:myosin-14-like n=1 Tax=Nicotiana attenuata TaxID=49451 RepID=UPI000905654F|nr:PREDICTED: myosin-14-like [Nicotiana attenuata]
MFEGASSEALRKEDNAPSDSLEAIVVGDSPTLPAFSEEAIQEAQAMRTPDVEGAHGGRTPSMGTLPESKMALALHQEAFSKSRVELSQCEVDLQRLTEERNALKLLNRQKEEEIKDLRAELATTHKVHQKAERIEQLREEGNMMKAETLGWKQNMDRLASEKEVARAQLSSAVSQLQDIQEKNSAQAKKIEELEARLATELAKAKSEAEKAKADAEAIVAVYRSDTKASQVQARESTEAAQTRALWIAEFAKCQSRRETLEEIHARGYDLTDEIRKAKELEDHPTR